MKVILKGTPFILFLILISYFSYSQNVVTVTLDQCIAVGFSGKKQTYIEIIKSSTDIETITLTSDKETEVNGKLVDVLNKLNGEGYKIKTSFSSFKSTTSCFYTTYTLEKE